MHLECYYLQAAQQNVQSLGAEDIGAGCTSSCATLLVRPRLLLHQESACSSMQLSTGSDANIIAAASACVCAAQPIIAYHSWLMSAW